MKNGAPQLTIRNLPDSVNAALRKTAAHERVSMNSAAIEALKRGLGLADEPVRHHDLDYLAGTWVKDRHFDKAIQAQRQIEPGMWK